MSYSTVERRTLDILEAEIRKAGKPLDEADGYPSGVIGIPEKSWRDEFIRRLAGDRKQGTRQKAFRRAADALLDDGLIGFRDPYVWVTADIVAFARGRSATV